MGVIRCMDRKPAVSHSSVFPDFHNACQFVPQFELFLACSITPGNHMNIFGDERVEWAKYRCAGAACFRTPRVPVGHNRDSAHLRVHACRRARACALCNVIVAITVCDC
jgi:hypothetical protein